MFPFGSIKFTRYIPQQSSKASLRFFDDVNLFLILSIQKFRIISICLPFNLKWLDFFYVFYSGVEIVSSDFKKLRIKGSARGYMGSQYTHHLFAEAVFITVYEPVISSKRIVRVLTEKDRRRERFFSIDYLIFKLQLQIPNRKPTTMDEVTC